MHKSKKVDKQMTNAIAINKTTNLIMPSHYLEPDKEEMSYVEGGAYLSNSFCCAIATFCGAVALTATGVVCAGSIAGANLLTAGIFQLKIIGAKLASSIGAFCAANPWAIPIIAFVAAWAICNKDNFLELGYNIICAAVSGKGVQFGISWFQLYSYVK